MSYDDCYCDYDRPSVYRQSVVRARKERQCDECARKIKAGDRYQYTFGIWEGYPSSFYTCSSCTDILQWTKNNVPCLCFAHGNIHEDIRNAVEAARWRAPEETRGLAFGLGRLLVKARRERIAA